MNNISIFLLFKLLYILIDNYYKKYINKIRIDLKRIIENIFIDFSNI